MIGQISSNFGLTMGCVNSVQKPPEDVDIGDEDSDSDDEDIFNMRRSASVDTFYRGPLVVMYESIIIHPNWSNEFCQNLSVHTHIACEKCETGKVMGSVAKWQPHEIIPSQDLYVGKTKSLNCYREENISIICTVTIMSTDNSNKNDLPLKKIKVYGALVLDDFPLEFNEPRKIILTDSVQPIQVNSKTVNDAVLNGTRFYHTIQIYMYFILIYIATNVEI